MRLSRETMANIMTNDFFLPFYISSLVTVFLNAESPSLYHSAGPDHIGLHRGNYNLRRRRRPCMFDGARPYELWQWDGVVLRVSNTMEAVPRLLEYFSHVLRQRSAFAGGHILLHLLRAASTKNHSIILAQDRMVHQPPQSSLFQCQTIPRASLGKLFVDVKTQIVDIHCAED
jgi:hypothetical protein